MSGKSPALVGQRRLYLFAAILVLWLGAICARLVYLQIFCYGDYVQRAQRQQQRSLEVAPQRGVIYDRNGQALAMSVMVDSIFAVPSEIPDAATTSALIGRILKQDPHEIMAHLKSSRAFCWIARKVDKDSADRIRALNLKGIYFQKEPKRFYPKRELAAQVLGYVGMDDEGLGGIERAFDSRLRGKPGKMLISVDARQKWFGRVEQQPEAGDDLVLTLDDRIQYIAERELDAAVKQTQSLAGTVIVENPHSGEILALANWPTFDPNSLAQTSPQALNNRAVSDIYEPGSTFKVVTLAAALEEKITRPDEVIDCQMGSIEIAGHTIHDHKAYADLTVAQVLSNSSDIGAIKLGLRLGDERFDQYIRAFGFGKQTGIELPGETRGMTKPVSRWSRTSIGAISMGQEIGVSALQLASMMSTIANEGVYEAPRIVAGSVEDETQNGLRKVVFHPTGERRVISTLTAAEMKTMLEGVVLNGTGKKAILNGYTSAGKTGTAQKIDPHTGTYSRTQYIASFAGFAPVNNPAVTVLVILDSPRNGSHEGGVAAAPVWARIMQQVLAYLNVSHDASFSDRRRLLLRAANSVAESEIADGAGDRLGDSLDSMAEADPAAYAAAPQDSSSASPLKPASLASPRPKEATPASSAYMAMLPPPPQPEKTLHGTAVLEVDSGVTVPSLIGMPVRNALEAAASAGLELQIVGSGVAREQSPPPGSHIAPGGTISVRFAR
jgi:cell division protein FtsI (penicillin-binding protein 3)